MSSEASASIPDPLTCCTTWAPEQTMCIRWVIKNAKVFLDNQVNAAGGLVSPKMEVLLPLRNKTIKTSFHLKCARVYSGSSGYYYYVYLYNGPNSAFENDQNRPCVVISNFTLTSLNCKTNETTTIYGPTTFPFTIASKDAEDNCTTVNIGSFQSYVHNDTLIIQASGTLQCYSDPSETVEDVRKMPPDNIRDQLQSLHERKLFTDLTIKCGEREFKAHKAVLASQSPVFERMLEADMRERSSNVIDVSDVKPQVMEAALAYLYTGTAPNMSLHVKELINVANKYQIARLLEMCEIELHSKIEVNNVVEILLLADLHNSGYLKRACLRFIQLNTSAVHKTREWKDFKVSLTKYPALMMEMLEFNDKPEN